MNIRLSGYLVTLVLTIHSFNLMSQDHLSILSAKEWQIEKVDLPGIGSNNIFEEIVQDSFGFLWIGTGDGLIRYDGYRTKIFVHEPDDPNSLSSSDISELYLQDERYLWIGTYNKGGLNRLDLTSGIITHYLDSVSVTEIIQDSNGYLWVGSDGVIYRFNLSTDLVQPSRYVLGDTMNSTVWTIIQDRMGTIWAGLGQTTDEVIHVGGIYQYLPDKDAFQHQVLQLEYPDELFNAPVTALLDDSFGNFWVGTSKGNLYQLNPQTSILESIQLNPPTEDSSWISTIYEDLHRKVWIVTARRALFRIDPISGDQMHFGTNYSISRQIPSDIGWTILQSRDSVCWIGGGRAGGILYKIFETTRQLSTIPLSGLPTYSFLENKLSLSPEIWISTDDGIVLFDLANGTKKHFTQDLLVPQAKESIVIHNLRHGLDSSLWAVCLSINEKEFNGLLKFDPFNEQARFYSLQVDAAGLGYQLHNFLYNTVRDYEFDNSGRILIATLGAGLFLFDPQNEQFVNYQHFLPRSEDLPSNFTSDLFKDQNGSIYITGWKRQKASADGFGSKFLARLNPDFSSLVNLELPSSINSPGRRCFEELFNAGNEGIWLLSRRDGLIRLDVQRNIAQIINSTNSDLLPQDISIAIKDQEQFWLKSSNLIYRFDPVKGKVTSNLIKCDNCETTMEPFDFRKALLRQDGTILIGAENGFLRLDPQLSHQSIDSRVTFSSIKILKEKNDSLGRSLDFFSSLQPVDLKHDENSFVINFFIPDFREPENNQYEFRLDNYDNGWRETVALPEAIYRKLAPGQYRFQVRAKGYRYSEVIESTIQINILPPWYWAWWSKSLYFLLIILSVYGFYRFQLKRQLAIAEASRLRELDVFKNRLYTNITHEFRTPLTVILGLADQLQDQVIERGKEGLHMIKRNGNRLLNLVNQMLDLQKLEAGAMPVHLVQDNIIQYLKYLVESFSSLATSKNIELQFQADPQSLVMDYDPDKIQHIISNLVSNALKFTNEGGFVEITCKQDSNSQVLIIVRDNGIGISEEKLPHIFDRFYQADDSSIRLGEGSGIGLSLTRELVLLLGGQISVKSIQGAGSEFRVILPITRNAPSMSPALKEIKTREPISFTTTSTSDEHLLNKDLPQVLVIEDNSDVVQYIRSILQSDYQISTASNGQDGLSYAMENIPDLIISDVMMPQMDGFEVCNTLKQDTRTSHIPVILLTAKADINSKLEGLQYGADAYLTKPFLKDELLVHIRSLLKLKQRLQSYYLRLYGVLKDVDTDVVSSPISVPESEFITKIRSIIRDHLDDSAFGVDQLCHAMAMSNSQLFRKLKAHTGLSAQGLIQSIRLSRAKELLKKTENNVSEIAYDCGFNNPEYFSRVFKKEFGVSPTDFRNQ